MVLKTYSLYCWRTRRLLAAQHLSAFEAMVDGDIGRVSSVKLFMEKLFISDKVHNEVVCRFKPLTLLSFD